MSKRKRKSNDPYARYGRDKRTPAQKKHDWFNEKSRLLKTNPSPAEAALWEHLRLQRCGHLFHWNYPYPPYILDFVCFNSAVVVEVDGEFHSATQTADEERDMALTRKGAKVMRFMAKDVVRDPQAIARIIADVCMARKGIPSAL